MTCTQSHNVRLFLHPNASRGVIGSVIHTTHSVLRIAGSLYKQSKHPFHLDVDRTDGTCPPRQTRADHRLHVNPKLSHPISHTHIALSGGIGQATARAFARQGCSIAVHHSSSHSKAKADALVVELRTLAPGVRAVAFEADLSTYDNARALHAEVIRELGHPDILFSNHGIAGPKIGPEGDIQMVSAETFEEVWRTNTGTGYVVSAQLSRTITLVERGPHGLHSLRSSASLICKSRSGDE